MTKHSLLLFDVNETLLNMQPLKQSVNALMKNEQAFKIWFGMLLHYSLVDNSIGLYHDFSEIAKDTIDMAAYSLGTSITSNQKSETLSLIRKLPAYSDVPGGLQKLKDQGYRLAALTNSPTATMLAQLAYSDLDHFFEKMLSVDAVKRYKPARVTYEYAASQLGTSSADIMMVAAHGWDVAGALEAGMQAAFIEREGKSIYKLAQPPTMVAKDIVDLAEKLSNG